MIRILILTLLLAVIQTSRVPLPLLDTENLYNDVEYMGSDHLRHRERRDVSFSQASTPHTHALERRHPNSPVKQTSPLVPKPKASLFSYDADEEETSLSMDDDVQLNRQNARSSSMIYSSREYQDPTSGSSDLYDNMQTAPLLHYWSASMTDQQWKNATRLDSIIDPTQSLVSGNSSTLVINPNMEDGFVQQVDGDSDRDRRITRHVRHELNFRLPAMDGVLVQSKSMSPGTFSRVFDFGDDNSEPNCKRSKTKDDSHKSDSSGSSRSALFVRDSVNGRSSSSSMSKHASSGSLGSEKQQTLSEWQVLLRPVSCGILDEELEINDDVVTRKPGFKDQSPDSVGSSHSSTGSNAHRILPVDEIVLHVHEDPYRNEKSQAISPGRMSLFSNPMHQISVSSPRSKPSGTGSHNRARIRSAVFCSICSFLNPWRCLRHVITRCACPHQANNQN